MDDVILQGCFMALRVTPFLPTVQHFPSEHPKHIPDMQDVGGAVQKIIFTSSNKTCREIRKLLLYTCWSCTSKHNGRSLLNARLYRDEDYDHPLQP